MTDQPPMTPGFRLKDTSAEQRADELDRATLSEDAEAERQALHDAEFTRQIGPEYPPNKTKPIFEAEQHPEFNRAFRDHIYNSLHHLSETIDQYASQTNNKIDIAEEALKFLQTSVTTANRRLEKLLDYDGSKEDHIQTCLGTIYKKLTAIDDLTNKTATSVKTLKKSLAVTKPKRITKKKIVKKKTRRRK